MNNRSKRWISSEKWFLQVFGAVFSHWLPMLAFVVVLVLPIFLLVIRLRCAKIDCCFFASIVNWNGVCLMMHRSLWKIGLVLSIVLSALVGYVVNKLNPIFSLRKQELRITWSKVVFLFTIGLVIVAIVENIKFTEHGPEKYIVGIGGALLTWIFQDTIKSVGAFFYLRINGLLKIGDWIQVPKHNIDGMVKLVTLTTVTIENWDTTTSAFPTYFLLAEHFVNNQDMLEGKTHGRRLMKNFIINTNGIHPLTSKEVETVKEKLSGCVALKPYIDALKVGEQNISAYREYIYQMLYNHSKVSHHPRLLVNWQEQVGEGMPLQVYAFITETSRAAFEWEQSAITEHIIEALSWFGLQLYQKVSGYDVNNNMNVKEITEYEK